MQLESIDDLASRDLAKRRLKIGDYGLVTLNQDEMAKILGYHHFSKAPYGIGIPYPNGQIGNIRMGSPFEGSKYLSTGLAGGTIWHAGPDDGEVFITEGEFKAMCIDQHAKHEELSIKSIGIFGVSGWSGKSERRSISTYLTDLVRGKSVTIIFDYDGDDVTAEVFTGAPKPAVQQAEMKLCATLFALGCTVYTVRIGRYSNLERRDKYAVDDYLLGGGKLSALIRSRQKYKFTPTAFDSTAEEATAYALTAYGVYQGNYVRLKDGSLLNKQAGLMTWTADVGVYPPPERDGPGRPAGPVRPLVNILDSPKLTVVDEWIYAPEEPYGYRGHGKFNMWKGWGQGVEGDPSTWLQTVEFVLPPDEREFFHDWVAYLVQNPGSKNFTYIALVSPQNGAGKSLLAETVMGMMEPCAGVFDAERLFSKNNEALEGKALVVINELSSDKARHVNEFKAMVTGATMTLEEKYKAARTVPNIANFMITTNELAPLLVHSTNRRDVIMRVNFLSDKQILEIGRKALVLVDWCKAGGYRIMQHWYEQRDISKYNPFGYAPRFKGFADAVEASKSNNQIYADEVLDFAATLENGALITRDMIEVLCGVDQHAALQVIRLLMKAQEYSGKHKVKEGKGNLSWAHLIGVPRDKVVNMSALIRDTRDALAQQMMP